MASEKAQLIESIQKNVGKQNWKAAIDDMEKLFDIEPDPIIRVRIGDVFQKLKQVPDAVREYVYAADLYAIKAVIVKALAQYKLALRLDPTNKQANQKMAALHSNKAITEKKSQPVDASASKSVIPLFAGLSPEEFEDLTKMMLVHTLRPGHAIVRQGDTGKSVYIIASGTVKVYINQPTGERLDLAVLNPNDFFGEMSFLLGKPRTATVETAEESVILEVTEDQLRDLIGRRPRILQVLQQYCDARDKVTSEKMQSTKPPEAPLQPAAVVPSIPVQQDEPLVEPEQPVAPPKAFVPTPPPPKAPEPVVPPVAAAPAQPAAPAAPKVPAVTLADKPKLIDAIQQHVSKANWKAVIEEMEKLFTIDPDPIIRVRIGDAYQKLNQKPTAVLEYMRAADLYAEKGAVVKALAQYKLVLRIDPGNKHAQEHIEGLHSNKAVKSVNVEQHATEKTAPKPPASSVMPLFAGFTQDEFNAFTQVMNVHPLPEGVPIVEQNDTGKSVYLIASGSVKVFTTMLNGERVDLAVLHSGDFFGEMSFLNGKPRTATVETAEDSTILEVTEDKLKELVAQRPHILEALQEYSEKRSKGTTTKIQDTNK